MNRLLIYDYELILLEKKKNFSTLLFHSSITKNGNSSDFCKQKNTETNQKNALTIIRYAIEKILCWTPMEAKEYLNYDILVKLKLCPLLQYLSFPPELSKSKDFFYIAHLVYPNIIKMDERNLCIASFEKMLKTPNSCFPKDYFDNTTGLTRAAICLQYAINNYIVPASVKELYELFSKEKQILPILSNYKLSKPCQEFFDKPIDYLDFALPESQKNAFYYHYYCFLVEYSLFVNERIKP